MWPAFREKLRERSKALYAMLDAAIVRAVDGDTLVLAHPAPTLARRLVEPHNAEVIREALKDVLGVDWRLRCEVGGAESAVPAAPPQAESGQDPSREQRAEEDAMIAEAGDHESAAPRRDPEEVALELLQSELGARRIDG